MARSFTGRKRVRKSFGRIAEVIQMPNLIEVQKKSYDQFLQLGIKQTDRTDTGLQEVLKSVFPINLRAGGAEVRRRGVPAAGDHLCRAP